MVWDGRWYRTCVLSVNILPTECNESSTDGSAERQSLLSARNSLAPLRADQPAQRRDSSPRAAGSRGLAPPPLGGLWQVLRSLVVAVAPVSGMDFRVFRVFRVTYARARDADPAPTCRKPAARRA